ncbi:MAG: cyclase family protein [Clostridia bacterium]|nr:cyclase family protein [Clostridia bacterium]
MKIYDISQEVFSCNVFPGDPTPKNETLCSMDSGDAYNLTAFSMCAHNGTHIDAPRHFIDRGAAVDDLPLECFVGDCYLARCEGDVTEEKALEIMKRAKEAQADERILLAGDLTVTASAARVFASFGLKLLGNESQTVGPSDSPMEVHKLLLGAGTVLLEGIKLCGIEEGRYHLSAAPLNLASSDGAPCRAYLISEE